MNEVERASKYLKTNPKKINFVPPWERQNCYAIFEVYKMRDWTDEKLEELKKDGIIDSYVSFGDHYQVWVKHERFNR